MIKVTKENSKGRNLQFKDKQNNMSRKDFVNKIEQGKYPDYHIRLINKMKTPVSNPSKNKKNNLG